MKFVKYILIIILSIGLYFTWFEKTNIENKSNKFKEKIYKLEDKIKNLQNDLKKSKQVINKIYIENNNTKNQTINIILPDTKMDYSTIIPEVDYKNINLKLTNKEKKRDDVKFVPNITFDKNKKIDKIELQIKTKF